jgi:hypothetical protein
MRQNEQREPAQQTGIAVVKSGAAGPAFVGDARCALFFYDACYFMAASYISATFSQLTK